MSDKPIDLDAIRACSKYSGGGYFVAPDASMDKPSALLHAPDVRSALLDRLQRAEAERDAARERCSAGRLFEVAGAIVAQQPSTFLWHITREVDGRCEALRSDGKWIRFNHLRGPADDCAYATADAAFAALAARGGA